MFKRQRPTLITIFIVSVTLGLWFYSKTLISYSIGPGVLISLSEVCALTAIILMSLSPVLSARYMLVERFFGGLDKAYNFHKTIGALAFVLALLHPLLLVLTTLPKIKYAYVYLFPGPDLAYTLGVFAVYVMLASFVFMLFINLPYELWKLSHQLLGVTFILAGTHALLIPSNVRDFMPLKLWILLFLAAGIYSLLYKIFMYKTYGPRFTYKVKNVEIRGGVTNLYLISAFSKLKFKAGQFCYISPYDKKIGSEMHPFSFSSAPDDEEIRVSPKALGDFTFRLQSIKIGDLVDIYGPYGGFGNIYADSLDTDTLVWIAGGIGITPFMSLLRSEMLKPTGKKIFLIYSVRTLSDAVFNEEIAGCVETLPNVRYLLWQTDLRGKVGAKDVLGFVGNSLGLSVSLCGPQPVMDALREQFADLGVRRDRIISEDFALL